MRFFAALSLFLVLGACKSERSHASEARCGAGRGGCPDGSDCYFEYDGNGNAVMPGYCAPLCNPAGDPNGKCPGGLRCQPAPSGGPRLYNVTQLVCLPPN